MNLEAASLIIQIFLGLFAIWYTIETRLLRKQNQEQLEIIKKDRRLSITPYLLISAVTGQKYIELATKKIDGKEHKEMQIVSPHLGKGYIANISNVSNNIALKITCYIYELRTKSYLRSHSGIENLEPKEYLPLFVPELFINDVELKQSIENDYGNLGKKIFPLIIQSSKFPNNSCLYVVYCDLEGNSYLVMRPFKIDQDGDLNFGASAIHSLPISD